MTDSTLLLRLAGVTQGWDVRACNITPAPGAAASTPHGPDDLIPTATGIAGLLASALGRPRGQWTDLTELPMRVRVDQAGTARAEFRTRRRRTTAGKVITQPTVETVLDDAVFVAGVSGHREQLERIGEALSAPRWPLFLGRREFPPTGPLLLGITDTPSETALREHPWVAAQWWRQQLPPEALLRLVRVRPTGRGDPAAVEELAPVTVPNPQGSGIDWLSVLEAPIEG